MRLADRRQPGRVTRVYLSKVVHRRRVSATSAGPPRRRPPVAESSVWAVLWSTAGRKPVQHGGLVQRDVPQVFIHNECLGTRTLGVPAKVAPVVDDEHSALGDPRRRDVGDGQSVQLGRRDSSPTKPHISGCAGEPACSLNCTASRNGATHAMIAMSSAEAPRRAKQCDLYAWSARRITRAPIGSKMSKSCCLGAFAKPREPPHSAEMRGLPAIRRNRTTAAR